MQAVTTLGLDIAKSVFQVHGIDTEGKVIIRHKLKRRYVLAFFQKLPPCLVGIEACIEKRQPTTSVNLSLTPGGTGTKTSREQRRRATMQSTRRGGRRSRISRAEADHQGTGRFARSMRLLHLR
ncbi:MAG: hypothetical protein WB662_00260, partial [Methyloceanibacter sp.]